MSMNPAFQELLAQAQSRIRANAMAEEQRLSEERAQNLENFRNSFPLTREEQQALGVEFYIFRDSTRAYAAIPRVWGDDYLVISPEAGRWVAELHRKGARVGNLLTRIEPAQLRDQLVLAIAQYREKREAELAEQARKEQEQAALAEQQQRREADAKARHEQRQAVIEAKRAEVLATHAELVTEVEAKKAAALAALWQWPAGATLTLYRWRWNLAAAVSENNELIADYDDGWSLQPEPDVDGFVFFQPAFSRPRGLSIKPINVAFVERHIFTSVADLHDDLVRAESLRLSGIGYHSGYHDAPITTEHGDRVDVHPESDRSVLMRGDRKELLIELGNLPRPWVRALVEQAALRVAGTSSTVTINTNVVTRP